MKRGDYSDFGMFEGFNFRDQEAIDWVLTAEQVLNWDHDADGEAEFWPDGSNVFVSKLLSKSSCSSHEVRQALRIFEELESDPMQLAKAVYLKESGSSLEDITTEAIEDSNLYVFGPGWFFDLEKEAAYELLEMFWPEGYALWEKQKVPGLSFDVENFMQLFSTLELKVSEGGYLIVEVQ